MNISEIIFVLFTKGFLNIFDYTFTHNNLYIYSLFILFVIFLLLILFWTFQHF